jgi:acetyl esterase/lipase
MPENTPDEALSDAIALFTHLTSEKTGSLIIVGSSSGGQLAAQVSQAWARSPHTGSTLGKLKGVLLRCPVTCNPSTPSSLPSKYQALHASLNEPSFQNAVIRATCVDGERRTFEAPLPLEAEDFVVNRLPRHWVQLCTNDLFYSDGACYVDLLLDHGVKVKTDLVVGWPHTFWLKHPERKYSRPVIELRWNEQKYETFANDIGIVVDRAVQAEADMLEGLKWLLKGE